MAEAIQESISNDNAFDKFFSSGGTDTSELDALGGAEQEAEPEAPPEQQQAEQEEQQQVEQEQQQPKVDKTVPIGALHEERERRKELQRQMQLQEERVARMEQAYQNVLERFIPQQQQQAEPEPDDPIDKIEYRLQKLNSNVAQHSQLINEYQQQQLQQQQFEQFKSHCGQQVGQFIQQQPDYMNAYEFFINAKAQEYQTAGYTPQQVALIVAEQEKAIAANALSTGANPAERIYQLAKLQGYQPPQQQAQQQQVQHNPLAEHERRASAPKSLGSATGKAVSNGLPTLEQLAQMSDDELDRVDWKKFIAGNR